MKKENTKNFFEKISLFFDFFVVFSKIEENRTFLFVLSIFALFTFYQSRFLFSKYNRENEKIIGFNNRILSGLLGNKKYEKRVSMFVKKFKIIKIFLFFIEILKLFSRSYICDNLNVFLFYQLNFKKKETNLITCIFQLLVNSRRTLID